MNAAGNNMDASTIPVCMLATCSNVEDGQWYDVSIQWEYLSATSQRMSVLFNGALRTTSTRNHIAERFSNNTNVFWSVAGSTGGSKNLQQFQVTPANNNNLSFCTGQNFTLPLLCWAPVISWTGSASVTNTASYTATGSGVISCSFTDFCGQSRTVNFTIVVNPVPAASLNNPQVCPGTAATLTATLDVPGTYSYVWTVPSGATNPGNVPGFTTSTAGVYSVVATHNVSGCVSNSATGIVSFFHKPVATVNNPLPVCNGQQSTITATPDIPGSYNYVWTVPSGVPDPGNVASFTATVAGTYSVIITNAATTCASDMASATLTVHAVPAVTVNNPQPCDGENALLTATPSVPGNYNYIWTVPTGVNNPGNTAGFSTTVAGNYAVQIINSTTGCAGNTANAAVSFLPVPVVAVSNATVCAGTQAQVIAAAAVPGSYSYNWVVPAGAANPGNAASFLTGVAGVYSVIVTNTVTGCNSLISQGTVTVQPIEEPQFSNVQPVCQGDFIAPLPNLSLNSISGGWSPAVNNTATTFYTFTPAAGLCADTASMLIQVNNTPVINLGADKEICPGQQIVLNPNATGFGLQYQWQDGSSDAVFMAIAVGDYAVTVSNQCGTTSDEITIKQGVCRVYIPSGFTPDNDGLNDRFSITGATYVKDFSLQVYNRGGQLIFTSANAVQGLDGTYRGAAQPGGIYIYKIHFTYLLTGEKHAANGTFVLVR
ncbi:MAG: gliding motility-associated C-terminal domain-containing protein [Chitinophagaceae bacterium]|nr:gliding motility-associated C-terminal domain-containing protein [Chitinophagaceae bacterium]